VVAAVCAGDAVGVTVGGGAELDGGVTDGPGAAERHEAEEVPPQAAVTVIAERNEPAAKSRRSRPGGHGCTQVG